MQHVNGLQMNFQTLVQKSIHCSAALVHWMVRPFEFENQEVLTALIQPATSIEMDITPSLTSQFEMQSIDSRSFLLSVQGLRMPLYHLVYLFFLECWKKESYLVTTGLKQTMPAPAMNT